MRTVCTEGLALRRRGGAAMLEMVLAVPMLALILGLTFFFGQAMMNQQKVRLAGRYNSWKYIHTHSRDSGGQINRVFFDSRAGDVDQDFRNVPAGQVPLTPEELVAAVAESSRRAAGLAEELVLSHFHAHYGNSIDADFPTEVGLWNNLGLTGPISAYHVRQGVEWRRGQIREGAPVTSTPPADAIKDEFLLPLDEMLSSVGPPGGNLAEALRRLYMRGW